MQAKRKVEDDIKYSTVYTAPVDGSFANGVIFRIIKSHAYPNPNSYFIPYLKFQFNGWEAWHITINQEEIEKIISIKELQHGENILSKRNSRETIVFREKINEKEIIRFHQIRNVTVQDIIISLDKWSYFQEMIQHLQYFLLFSMNPKKNDAVPDKIFKILVQVLIRKYSVYSVEYVAELLEIFKNMYPQCDENIPDSIKATLAWVLQQERLHGLIQKSLKFLSDMFNEDLLGYTNEILYKISLEAAKDLNTYEVDELYQAISYLLN